MKRKKIGGGDDLEMKRFIFLYTSLILVILLFCVILLYTPVEKMEYMGKFMRWCIVSVLIPFKDVPYKQKKCPKKFLGKDDANHRNNPKNTK